MGTVSPAWHAVLGLDAPWSPVQVAAPGGAPLLLLRAALLVAAAFHLVSMPNRRSLTRFGIVGALVFASLLWRGTVAPAVLLSVAILCTNAAWSRTVKVGGAAAAAVVAVLALSWPSLFPAALPDALGSPPEETTRALDRGNLYEARFWAARWAKLEADDPRDGALIWARIEDRAGHVDLARQIAADVAARAHAEPIRARARAELASFATEPTK